MLALVCAALLSLNLHEPPPSSEGEAADGDVATRELMGQRTQDYGELSPKAVSIARLRRVHAALRSFHDTHARMPSDAVELLESGFVESQDTLTDARQPLLVEDLLGRATHSPEMATFRLVREWRDGPIATTDLPRGGEWIILTGAGEVYAQPVDPAWLGRYEPAPLSDADREARIDRPAAQLGAYVSDAQTDSGRTGVGVDELIPGFYRTGISIPFTILGGETDLRPGDLIVTCDGVRVESVAGLEAVLSGSRTGLDSRPRLEVIREGRIEFVRPLSAHWFHGIDADTPRGRRDQALVLLAEEDPERARDVDLLLLGVLDIDRLMAREGVRERLPFEYWVRAWAHGRGSDAAVREIDAWVKETERASRTREELLLLRSQQLRLLGRFEEALIPIGRVEKYRVEEINRELVRADPDERASLQGDMLADLRDPWIARLGTLVDMGRVEESLELAREIADSGVHPEVLMEVIGDYINSLFLAGYPRAGIEAAREQAELFADEEGFADAIETLEEHVRALEIEVGG